MHVLHFGNEFNMEFAADYLSKSFQFTISLGKVMMKHSSSQFGD